MKLKQLLEEIQDVLQTEQTLTPELVLTEMEEWDSMAIMACMAYFDHNFDLKIEFERLEELHTISDLLNLVGPHLE